ncbi:Atypical/RIO/RIO1 protein kinase [Cryptococcus gattii E566]|nr:Atypical/RIO/RIO1 protein kinase [Cryptococcus gattii E566]
MSRRPDHGYIDQASEDPVNIVSAPIEDLEPVPHGKEEAEALNEDSGSSIEEESEGEPFEDEDGGDFDFSVLDVGGSGEEEEEEDDGDWDVDDEDWELANGDFTKQYNRVRQQHAATSGSAPLPARNLSQQTKSKLSKSNPTAGSGVVTNPKAAQDKHDKDKSDRATQEQVLDGRTRLVLAGLVNRGVIGMIERCISTGKEANVYYSSPGRAVKIYRTSILVFRARQNYIVGEQRFRGEYTSSRNPRKMIRVWAEKELRNLRRLVQGGVRAPVVHECKENVLVMDFLGKGEVASPRLKDADIPEDRLPDLYAELIIATRRMYQHCHLVHADLSEYNILLHDNHLYIIDVSQSVEHDHPRAFDFLRSDISNIEEFFSRRGVATLGIRRSWEFIVTENIGLSPSGSASISLEMEKGDEGESRLVGVLAEWLKEPSDKTDDAVFMESYIPRTLAEVYDPERDVDVLKRGGGDELIYAGVTGLKLAHESANAKEREKESAGAGGGVDVDVDVKDEEEGVDESVERSKKGKSKSKDEGSKNKKSTKSVRFEDGVNEQDEEDDAQKAEEGDEEEGMDKKSRGFRHEDRESKKERKKAVKEEQREKRKTKMPKAEKQKLIKKSASRH